MGWLRAYAAATSTTTTWETIRDAASSGSRPAKTTTIPYRDVLTRLRILDVVRPWIPINNHLSQVGMSPKHNLADPALAARLVGLEADALLDDEGPDARPYGTYALTEEPTKSTSSSNVATGKSWRSK